MSVNNHATTPHNKRQRTTKHTTNAAAGAPSDAPVPDEAPASMDSASASAAAPRPSTVLLFVGGLPSRITGIRRLLKTALNEGENAHANEEPTAPASAVDAHANSASSASASSFAHPRSPSSSSVCTVRVHVNSFNHHRSWASVSVRDLAAATRLIQRHHLRLRLPGTPASHPPLSVSLSAGLRLDSLFPFLPAALRPQMRMDVTAMFSVTYQEYAARTTQLILALTAVAMRDPNTQLRATLKVTKGTITAAAVDEALEKAKTAASAASAAGPDVPEESAEGDEAADDAMDGADTPRSSLAAASSSYSSPAALVYSPDPEINRIISEIADASWSTWTDLEEPAAADASGVALPPVRLARSPLSITDGCACSGGNALDFALHFRSTRAIELDAGRCADLHANAALLRLDSPAFSIVQGDATVELFRGPSQEVVFMDPPWGGPQYKEILAAQSAAAKATAAAAAAAAAQETTMAAGGAQVSSGLTSSVASGADLFFGSTSLTDLCLRLYESDACRLLVLRVPFEYDCGALAARLTALPSSLVAECKAAGVPLDPFQWPRPHPFRLMLGKVYLLAVGFPSKEQKRRARELILGGKAMEPTDATVPADVASASTAPASFSPSSAAPASPPLHFCLSNLDSLISVLNAYNALYQSECDPSFWDWEKDRWISLRRWKGCTLQPAEKSISEKQQAALRLEGAHKKAGQLRTLTEAQQLKQKQKNEKRSLQKQNKILAKQDRKRERENSESQPVEKGEQAPAASASTPVDSDCAPAVN